MRGSGAPNAGGKGRAAAPQGPGPRGRPPHSQPPIPAFGVRYPRILSSISGGRILDPPPTLDPAFSKKGLNDLRGGVYKIYEI